MQQEDFSNNHEGSDKELTPSELIKKHISDKEHIITNEELDNLKVGEEADDKTEIDKAVDEKLEEDGLKEDHETNSYDVLDL